MTEQFSPFSPFPPYAQQRIQALYDYTQAMEHGDAETIATVLQAAEHDAGLERMILEMNIVYQHEDHTAVQESDAIDAILVQKAQKAQKAISATLETMRSATMPTPDLNDPKNLVVLDSTATQTEAHVKANGQVISKAQKRAKVATPVSPLRKVTAQPWYRTRRTWITTAIAAGLIALLLLPGTSALANQFLSLFRVQGFQAVQVSKQDFNGHTVPDLSDLGTVQFQNGSFKTHSNLTQAQAVQMINFTLQFPGQLPQGVSGKPTFAVIDSGHGTFTFNAAKAHAYLAKQGNGNLPIPAKLDGSTYEITSSAGVEMHYAITNKPSFVILEVPSPDIQATGKASLQDLRDFMLSLPNLPPHLVAQLKQINLNTGTVPLPVPSGIASQSITVHGTSGLLLSNGKSTTVAGVKQFPAGSAVVWQSNNIIYAVGGTITDTNQLLATANSLH